VGGGGTRPSAEAQADGPARRTTGTLLTSMLDDGYGGSPELQAQVLLDAAACATAVAP